MGSPFGADGPADTPQEAAFFGRPAQDVQAGGSLMSNWGRQVTIMAVMVKRKEGTIDGAPLATARDVTVNGMLHNTGVMRRADWSGLST